MQLFIQTARFGGQRLFDANAVGVAHFLPEGEHGRQHLLRAGGFVEDVAFADIDQMALQMACFFRPDKARCAAVLLTRYPHWRSFAAML